MNLSRFEYSEKLIELIIATEALNKRYIKAPLPAWTNQHKEIRDQCLNYVNFPEPQKTGHRWYLKKNWDKVLSSIIQQYESD